MSFLIASGAAVLALTMQAHGAYAKPQTDSDAAVDECVAEDRQNVPADQLSKADLATIIGCIFRATSDQISSQLPMKMDATTTLVAVSSTGPRLNYTYLVDVNARDFGAQQVATLAESTRLSVCQSSDMADTISMGGSFFYRWVDKSGTALHSMLIESC